MEIFVAKNNQQLGPFDRATIDQKLASQEIALTDLAWVQGMANWQALSTILDGTATFANNAAPERTTIVPILPFLSYGIRAFKKPTFQGRARRMEGWSTFLIVIIVMIIMRVINSLFHLFDFHPIAGVPSLDKVNGIGSILAISIYYLFVLYSTYVQLTLNVRRCHDRGHSGWLALPIFLFSIFSLGFNVFILTTVKSDNPAQLQAAMTSFGGLFLIYGLLTFVVAGFGIYLGFFNSKPGANAYGPNPKNQ